MLQGTGGITDEIDRIVDTFKKDTGARLVYSQNPTDLITRLSAVYETKHFRRPSCFCDTVGIPAS